MVAKRALGLFLALGIGGCDEVRPDDALAESSESGPSRGGDHVVDPCGAAPIERALGWDAANAVGVTPEMAFGTASGTCTTTLRWSAAGVSELSTPPPSLETPLVVSVAFDPQSARIVGDDPALAARGCAPRLQASATVQLASEDGLLRTQQAATAGYTTAARRTGLSLSVPLSLGMPGAAVTLLPNESASLSIQLDGASSTCSGQVVLSREMSGPGPGQATGSVGRLAEWSNSGCPLGQSAVDLRATDGAGRPSIAALIAQRFANVVLHGAWSDGPSSDLTVSVSLASTSACVEDSGPKAVTVPARVTYATTDGRVGEHTAVASFRIEGDSQRRLQLYVDETLPCVNESAALFYTPVDCKRLEHVVLQFSLQAVEGAMGFDLTSSRLEAYEYLRGSHAAAGAADTVRTFQPSIGL